MKKTINNYTLVTLLNTINNKDSFWVDPNKKSKLKVSVPVRTVIKKNLEALTKLGESYMESYNDIISEVKDQYVQDSKALYSDDGVFKVIPEYKVAFDKEVEKQLVKLLQEEHEIVFNTYPEAALDKYAELNGDVLSELEMEALEFFIED